MNRGSLASLLSRLDVALAVYALGSVALTWPVALTLGERLAGDGADANLFVWNQWWFRTALAEGASPFATTMIHWPTGSSLALHTLSPWNALLATPIALVAGDVAAYNVVLLASLAACGLAAHALARDVTGSTRAAYVAGFAFTFTPYHFAHALGHLNLVSYYWLPLFALAFRRWLARSRPRDLALASAAIVGAGLTDLSLLLVLALFAVAFAAGALGVRSTKFLVRPLVAGLPAAVLLSPYLALVVLEYARTPGLGGFGSEAGRYSLDVASYVVPSPLATLYERVGVILTPDGTTTEASVFVGFAVLALAIVGFRAAPRDERRPWLVVAACFYVLSLGPWLQILGWSLPVPLPYAVVRYVPLLSTLRTPARFAIGVLLPVAILAAYGAMRLRWPSKVRMPAREPARSALAVACVLAIVALEAATLPYPTTPLAAGAAYPAELLDADALVELPLWQPGYDGYLQNVRYLAAQTLHGKPIVNGYTSRETPRDKQFLEGELVLSALWRLERGGVPPESADVFPEQDTRALAGDLLAARGLRTLLFHESAPGDEPETREAAFLATLGGLSRGPTIDGVTYWRAERGNATVLLDLDRGWHGLEADGERRFRWTAGDPTIVVVARDPIDARLSFDARAFVHDRLPERTMTILANGAPVAEVALGRDFEAVEAHVSLPAGESRIVLSSREDATVPARLLLNEDVRPLAFAIRDVRLTPR